MRVRFALMRAGALTGERAGDTNLLAVTHRWAQTYDFLAPVKLVMPRTMAGHLHGSCAAEVDHLLDCSRGDTGSK